jgi:hypothetical protein
MLKKNRSAMNKKVQIKNLNRMNLNQLFRKPLLNLQKNITAQPMINKTGADFYNILFNLLNCQKKILKQ